MFWKRFLSLLVLLLLTCVSGWTVNMADANSKEGVPPQGHAKFIQETKNDTEFTSKGVSTLSIVDGKCPCGCRCGPGCDCGCHKGKPCDCNPPKVSGQKETAPPIFFQQAPSSFYESSFDQGRWDWECDAQWECLPSFVEDLEMCCDGKHAFCPIPDRCDECGRPNNGYGFYGLYEPITDAVYDCCEGTFGMWIPEAPPLFRPFMADPRQVTYSVGWRFNDRIFDENVIDVSYGDIIPIYRWWNVGPMCGQLEIGLEGALWAIFEPTLESAPLVNADYYVGVPITYAFDCWAFRLRGYHISSHVGDEFLLNHPQFVRKNPSAEYIDLFASWQATERWRLYGGIGFIICSDSSFKDNGTYAELGTELYFKQLSFYDCKNHILGQPFIAADFKGQTPTDFAISSTIVAGYEFGKTIGLGRKIRVFFEYHDGFSEEGMFARNRTHYYAIRATYGF